MGTSQSGTENREAAANGSDSQQAATTETTKPKTATTGTVTTGTVTTDTTTTETAEVHEVPGNQVVKFVKRILHEGNVNRIQISRQDGEVLWGISLTAGVATTAAVTLLLPALIGLSLIVVMVSYLRVEVVRTAEANAERAQKATDKLGTAKEATVK